MTALLLFCVLVCAALPAAEVAAALPALWLAQGTLLQEHAALFNAGPIAVTPVDLLLFLLAGKLVFSAIRTRELVTHRAIYLAFGIYLLVNLLATLASGVKVADAPVSHSISALVRLSSEFALAPILAQLVKSLAQARRCAVILLVTLGGLAAIQFLNFFGASHGITIGEVQGIERGEVRYFGPMGDSVGTVLLLGYLYSLCASNFIGVGAFFGGIMLTAGLGAVFSTGVGTVLFLLFGLRASAARAFFARYFWLLPALGFAAIVAAVTIGQPLSKTLVDRISGGKYTDSAGQRVASGSLAVAMFADNPLTGVGYLEYESALPRYGGEKAFDLAHPDGATGNANNEILQVLADAGIPGLLAFAGLIFCAGRLLRELSTQVPDRLLATLFLSAFVWLLAQVLGNQAAVWLVPGSYVARFLWIILGIGIAVAHLRPSLDATTSAEARVHDREASFAST